MLASRLICTDGRCTVQGEVTTTGPADLVFAYTPTSVRFDGSRLVLDFDPPVQCDFLVSREYGKAFVYCAPVLKPVHLVEHDGDYFLEDGEEE